MKLQKRERQHLHSSPYLQRPRTQSRQGPAFWHLQVSHRRFWRPHSQVQSPKYDTMRIFGAAASFSFSCAHSHQHLQKMAKLQAKAKPNCVATRFARQGLSQGKAETATIRMFHPTSHITCKAS